MGTQLSVLVICLHIHPRLVGLSESILYTRAAPGYANDLRRNGDGAVGTSSWAASGLHGGLVSPVTFLGSGSDLVAEYH